MPVSKSAIPKNKNNSNDSEQQTDQSKPANFTSSEKREAANDYASANGSNADDVKYKMAVNTARNNLADKENVTDNDLKSAIDDELVKLGASKSGDELRGENGFTKTLDTLREFTDNVTLAGGNTLDWVFDNVAAGLVGIVSPETRDDMRNWFTGEDLQGVADAGIDIGLSALGPAGWAAMLGKNAVQQSDNLLTAFNGGKDRVTMEEGNGLANLAEGLGGIALSAVPAIGKVKNLSKFAKNAANTVQSPVRNTEELAELTGIKKVLNPFRTGKIDKELADAETTSRLLSKLEDATEKASKATDKASKAAEKASPSEAVKVAKDIKQSSKGIGKEIGKGILSFGAGPIGGMAVQAVPAIANGDTDGDNLSPDGNLGSIGLTGAVAGLAKKNAVSPSGTKGLGALLPIAAIAASNVMKQGDRMYDKERPKKTGMSDQEIMAALRVR